MTLDIQGTTEIAAALVKWLHIFCNIGRVSKWFALSFRLGAGITPRKLSFTQPRKNSLQVLKGCMAKSSVQKVDFRESSVGVCKTCKGTGVLGR